ncbi:MAG: hypothetical protein ACT4OS_11475 [Acidimicrobiales bacterium]
MPRVHYLTIRCPFGCEAWLAPPWLDGHRDRCTGRPWVDDLPDRAVVPAPLAGVLLSVLPRALVDDAQRPSVTRAQQDRVALDFRFGACVRSPVAGVTARRWLRVAIAALEAKGLESVRRALSPDGFGQLERELIEPGADVACPECGECVTARGLATHRATNAACRWRRAAREVREAWDTGWRDPFSVEGAPLTWAELVARMHWKRRLLTVDFPRWTAVLLKPQ